MAGGPPIKESTPVIRNIFDRLKPKPAEPASGGTENLATIRQRLEAEVVKAEEAKLKEKQELQKAAEAFRQEQRVEHLKGIRRAFGGEEEDK